MSGSVVPTGTPAWLLRPEPGLCPCGCIGRRRKRSYVRATISGGARMAASAMFADDTAGASGLLQRVEPRTKLLTLLGLLVAAAFVHHVAALVILAAGTVAVAAASRIPLRVFLGRVWLFVPIFTGIVVLPATTNLVTHGHVVVPLGTWFGHRVGLTRQGLDAAALIVTRVATSISIVLLLTLTTPWNRVLAALRALRIPRMFVLVLAMAYRYIFHLLQTVTDMFTARQARSVGGDGDSGAGRRFVGASAGALFAKSHALSEEVHMAMTSRGFTGEIRDLRPASVRPVDWVWTSACVAMVLLTAGVDRVIGR